MGVKLIWYVPAVAIIGSVIVICDNNDDDDNDAIDDSGCCGCGDVDESIVNCSNVSGNRWTFVIYIK